MRPIAATHPQGGLDPVDIHGPRGDRPSTPVAQAHIDRVCYALDRILVLQAAVGGIAHPEIGGLIPVVQVTGFITIIPDIMPEMM